MRSLPALVASMCLLAVAGCTSTAAHRPAPVAAGSPTTTRAVPPPPTAQPVASTPPSTGSPSSASGLAGTWNGTYQSVKYPRVHGTFEVTFTVTGHTVAGKVHIESDCVGDGTVTGDVTNDRISFGVVKAAETISFEGTMSAASLHGTYHSGAGCGDDNGTWAATRG